MNEHLQFLQAFLKNPLYVGAISPSSPDLARAMIEDVQPDENNVALELGVGTGAITKFLRGVVPDEKSYIGIEISEDFVEKLKTDFPDLLFVCGSAGDAREIHKNTGFGKVGYIVSGLPFASLPKEVSQAILGEVDKFLAEGCLFRTFQYAHAYRLPPAVKFRKYMEERYGKVKRSSLVLKNMPPAYTLTWKT
ncbi:MAG TPA: methyltransferase domain-containing protein [Pyrinomonadaceae bacterium]|jgi:phospholipid N-methyltransferase